ncbi:hypothetical protein ABZS81_24560 [Streptomyces sp. NPDC005318]|uniref:hypothetical protein n=1 Tax=Streptomyces sp. NPDC005318 TaxID=3157031 RepID=UPI0033B53DE8
MYGGLAALVLAGHGSLPLMCLLAVAAGSATALFAPAMDGVVPLVVPTGQLQQAHGLLRVGTNIRGASTGCCCAALIVLATVAALLAPQVRALRTCGQTGRPSEGPSVIRGSADARPASGEAAEQPGQ